MWGAHVRAHKLPPCLALSRYPLLTLPLSHSRALSPLLAELLTHCVSRPLARTAAREKMNVRASVMAIGARHCTIVSYSCVAAHNSQAGRPTCLRGAAAQTFSKRATARFGHHVRVSRYGCCCARGTSHLVAVLLPLRHHQTQRRGACCHWLHGRRLLRLSVIHGSTLWPDSRADPVRSCCGTNTVGPMAMSGRQVSSWGGL